MIELLQVTNDPALAARSDRLPGMRVWIDLERAGKAERQAGRDTFISDHQLADIAPVKAALRHGRLMVRVNPLSAQTPAEVDAVLAAGADRLMLPMFRTPADLRDFLAVVDGRCPVTALLETREALDSLDGWAGLPGLDEIFVGLNDLHLSLRRRFMFEPLADGHVQRVAQAAALHGKRFGFGGIAQLDGGLLPGRDVLAEHLRLGSQAVILSRTFRDALDGDAMERQIAALRTAEASLQRRDALGVEADRLRIHAAIRDIAAAMAAGTKAAE